MLRHACLAAQRLTNPLRAAAPLSRPPRAPPLAPLLQPARLLAARAVGELKHYKPVTPSLRHRITIDKAGLWRGRPEKSLTQRISGQHQAGRNNTGQITVRGRMAPKHRRQLRIIDFKRDRTDAAEVIRLEYDPNRSGFIALVKYASDGKLSYILAPEELEVGASVRCGPDAPYAPGNAMPLADMPDGIQVHGLVGLGSTSAASWTGHAGTQHRALPGPRRPDVPRRGHLGQTLLKGRRLRAAQAELGRDTQGAPR